MSMTVSSMANSYYQMYAFLNSSAASGYSDGTSAVSENDYGVANLGSALSSLNSTTDTTGFITNLDSYVKSAYTLSQLPNGSVLSSLTGKGNLSDTALYGITNLSSYSSGSYQAYNMGLSTSASAFNPYGITGLSNYVSSALNAGKLSGMLSSSNSYNAYLSNELSATSGTSFDQYA